MELAVLQNEHEETQQEENLSSLFDSLYCEEESVGEEGFGEVDNNEANSKPCLLPLFLLEQELVWEDEELLFLFSREERIHLNLESGDTGLELSLVRREAVEWMLRVNAYYGFAPLTAILAVNYLDRFLSSLQFQREKPWMTQLAAVACLSLAAKVEETQVPLLLDLQVEDARFMFQAKIVQRMELLVLSTLQWRMNPVTAISFLDHIRRRLGPKNRLHWEFLKHCERLLLSVVSDSRLAGYLPSVLATATMLLVVQQVEPRNSTEYQNQLLGILNFSREDVNGCYQLVSELSLSRAIRFSGQEDKNKSPCKRKFQEIVRTPSSPSGVIDASFSSDDSLNESWSVGSSVSSSPSPEPPPKSARGQERQPSLIWLSL
ncbi:hypothetical protein NMG60_11015265 [Bertholletia excelsa]